MHLTERAYALIVVAALLGIASIWSGLPALEGAWHWPALALLLGLTGEGLLLGRARIRATVQSDSRVLLGRPQPAAFALESDATWQQKVELAPVVPQGFEPLPGILRVTVPARSIASAPFELVPVALGPQSWPATSARLLGRLGLAWWSRDLAIERHLVVAPDTLQARRARPPRAAVLGMRPRRVVGAGSELHQLRSYIPGDPLARIDWKASARARGLVTREFSEDQHLEVLVAVDAGRLSRIRAGRIDRLGIYANLAARFAELAIPNDDRIGLVVFADRPVAVCAPERGVRAVAAIRRTLETLSVQPAESDVLAAAVRIRSLLKHRGLVVLLTDTDDTAATEQVARAIRLLSPPHLVVVASVHGAEIPALASREARNWRDPWIALAAHEHEARVAGQRLQLRRLGASVVAAREEHLEHAVFAEYESLRRRRRV